MSDKTEQRGSDRTKAKRKRRMHDDVATWEDTCSCEPEARWAEVGREMEEEAEGKDEG